MVCTQNLQIGMSKTLKWDERYLGLCRHVATWSEDPRKQVGACLVRDNRVLSIGFNGFPTGVKATKERLHTKELKLQFIEHAERNALYTAARVGVNLAGATMYCNWFPCNECAKGIIQAGITRVVTSKPDPESHWYPQMLVSVTMFTEAGIELVYPEEE